MPRPALPAPPPHTVTVRLPGGRFLIAILDPAVPDHRSPLRRHLRTETNSEGPKGLGSGTGTAEGIRGRSSPDKPPSLRHD
ncbi:hypothetical protein OH809_45005 (plasmid) [Streptomyces sp. NBC_00873]|uniref:hypothetical protein n=1 Tax=Streptomyces sp. NBC_00873 TaxID=2975852 RepID=UPI003867D25E|nr:hypothetical protein OH809_45005 [Streptomyces sp. NBC_00873]